MLKRMRGLWRVPLMVLSTWLLPGLPPYAATLPADCERSELDDTVRYDSSHLREERGPHFWQLDYPPPKRGAAAESVDLFAKEDLDQLTADPAAAGMRLMERVDDQLCRPRPETYTLEWYTYLQSEHGGTGPAWLTLASRQLIDGVPAGSLGCHANYDRRGTLLDLNCNLLAGNDVALPSEDWPDEAEVAAVAEAAYLDEMRNLPGPGQKVQSVVRLYRGGSPILVATHVGGGRTVVNARTLQARYNDGYGWPVRPLLGMAADERVVQLDNLPPDFQDEVFALDGSGGYLLAGRNIHPWKDAAEVFYEEARYLLAFDAEGRLRWRHRLASPHELRWLFPFDDHLLLWQPTGKDGISSGIRSQMLSLADGQPLESERLFDVPPYRKMLPDATGSRIYTLRDIEQQWQVWAQDRNGAVLWRADVPEANSSSDLVLSRGSGPAVLSYTRRDDPRHYKLRGFTRDGRLRQWVDLPVPKQNDAHLLGVEGERAYLLLRSTGADRRGHLELLIYSTTDSKLLQRHFLPSAATLKWLPGGKVLYFGSEGGWALLGDAGSETPWRRYFGFDASTQTFAQAAVNDEGKLALLVYLDYEQESALTLGRRTILRLDLSTAGEHGRAPDCPLVTDDTLRKLELALWRDFHLYLEPTLMDYLPNLACIDAYRAHYRDFMQALHDDLTRRAYRAPGFFVYLMVEPGQAGLRFRGGGAGTTPDWGDQLSYHLRAHFDDAAELAAYLHNTLEPHARRTYRLRDDFLLHTGAELSLVYPREDGPARLEKMEADLERVVQIARSMPTTAFPNFGEWVQPQLEMDDSRMSPLRNREGYSTRPVPLVELDAEQLKRLLQAQRQAWLLRRETGCKEGLARASGPDNRLLRALRCDDLEQLRRALSLGANPRRHTGAPGDRPLVHVAALNSPGGLDALVEAGADPLARDNQGNTTLHRAAMAGPRDVLVRLSADEVLVNTAAYDGATPLHRAVFAPRFPASLLAPLVRGQRDINTRNIAGETALHLATHSPEVVELLLDAGADPNARDQRGATPLHRAATVWLGADSVAALLAAGADSSLRDEAGNTAAMIAEQRRLPVNAALLAGRGAP